MGFKLPLRFTLAIIIVLVIIAVAATTMSITYIFALNAVRAIGRQHAEAITDDVVTVIDLYLKGPERTMLSYMRMVQFPKPYLPPYVLPQEDMDPDWDLKWLRPMQSLYISLNYSVASLAVLFLDGGMVVVGPSLKETNANRGLAYWTSLDPKSLDGPVSYTPGSIRTGNATITRNYYWNMKTMERIETASLGHGPELSCVCDARSEGFWQAYDFVGTAPNQCIWFPPQLDAIGTSFVLYGVCNIHNASMFHMGQASVGLDLGAISNFLTSVKATTNTRMFVVDNSGFVIATSAPDPFISVDENWTPSPVVPPGCSVSNTVYLATTKLVCRASIKQYPYGPLQSQSNQFVTSRYPLLEEQNHDDGRYIVITEPIEISFKYFSLNVVLFLPEDDIIGEVVEGRNISIIVTCLVAVIAVAFVVVLVAWLLAPLADISEHLMRTSRLENVDDGTTDSDSEIEEEDGETAPVARNRRRRSVLAGLDVTTYEDEDGNERRHVKTSKLQEIAALQVAFMTMDNAIQSFTRYVPRDVVKDLVSSGQLCQIAMKPRRCTMLFIDIAGFTTLCERVPAHVLSKLVRLYFERTSRLVMGHSGIIDKFIGDCIFAVWGAPFECNHQELRASLCARSMHHETTVDPLAGEFAAVGETLNVRVGVASGDVLAGNMGSAERMNYTVIGDAVNLAARLESLNKQWGTGTMISDETADEVKKFLTLRLIVVIAVVGKEDPVAVYEIMGVNPKGPERVAALNGNEDASSAGSGASSLSGSGSLSGSDDEGVAPEVAKGKKISCNKLLRRGLRRFMATTEQVKWALVHNEAMTAFRNKDFNGAIERLEGLGNSESPFFVSEAAGQHLSGMRILERAKVFQEEGAPPNFDGVFIAEEK